MKKKIKWFVSFGIVSVVSTAITTPILVEQNSNNSQTKISSKSSNVTSELDNANFLKLNTKTNYSYMLSKVSENTVWSYIQKSNDNSLLIQTSGLNHYSQSNTKNSFLLSKEKQTLNEIYSNKININHALNTLYNKYYSTLSLTQKESIQNKIDLAKNNIIEKQLDSNVDKKFGSLLYSYNANTDINSNSNSESYLDSQIQLLNSDLANEEEDLYSTKIAVGIFAGFATAAAVASAAIAIVLPFIPFWGWAEEAYAIADTIANLAAAAFAWTSFAALEKASSFIEKIGTIGTYCTTGSSPIFISVDISNIRKHNKENYLKIDQVDEDMSDLSSVVDADEATNVAGESAEPEVSSWYLVDMDTFSLLVDSFSALVGGILSLISNGISGIQKTISSLEDQEHSLVTDSK